MTAPTDVRPPGEGRPRIRIPAASGSTRALARRKRRQQRRRRIYLGALAAALAVAAIAAAVVMREDPAPRRKDEAALPAPVPHEPRVLLVHQGPDGAARSLALLAPDEETSHMFLIAPGTMAEVTSLGLEPLSTSLALGGAERLRATAENLLGIDVEHIVVVHDEQLNALVLPVQPLLVNIPSRVETIQPGGQVEVLYEPGVIEVNADEVARLMVRVGEENEMAVIARQQAFWQAYAESATAAPKAMAELKAPTIPADLGTAMRQMAEHDIKVKVVPVDPVGRDDQTDELYAVDEKALRNMLLAAFPSEEARLRQRIRVQILNGTGEVELAPRVAAKLLPAGVRIALTGNANRFNFDQTQVVFYERGDQALAERVRQALGVGRLVLSRNRLDVVDVTVIVGKDFTPS